MKTINSYKSLVGKDTIKRIRKKAKRLKGKHIAYISSTYNGGGVAEILNSILFMFNKEGIQVGWRILHGDDRFFNVTKKMHNALQGADINLSKRKKKIYHDVNKRYSVFTHIVHDLVVVHDPQPAAMIDFYKKRQPWIFRGHVDFSQPNKDIWNYLKRYLNKYDHFVVSKEDFKQPDLDIPQSVISPAINPFSTKNKTLRQTTVDKILRKYNISTRKPIISQISRFDPWKDPLGVLKIFEKVRAKKDCQLILLGSFATDDPEGIVIFEKVKKAAEQSKHKNDIKIIAVDDCLLVNCLQRASSVVIQKSLKEGFGLTVTEAMFKGSPVVASNVGGIPLQIEDGKNGFLCSPKNYESFARKILALLEDEKLRDDIGKAARDSVKDKFLMTRLMEDWLDLFLLYLDDKGR